ncbi:hypothetical protein [Nocardia sp. NPDC002869]|uniref:hypothetical protein n=1 Tax=Nocardia sp. NPDC002869 TaxID=3161032 RepID=UPI00398D1F6E
MRHLDEPAAGYEGMLTGWGRQQAARMLVATTIDPRIRLIRRFVEFTGSYPWAWTPADVEDFTVSSPSEAGGRLAPSTIRGYHVTIRMFCDYQPDPDRIVPGRRVVTPVVRSSLQVGCGGPRSSTLIPALHIQACTSAGLGVRLLLLGRGRMPGMVVIRKGDAA